MKITSAPIVAQAEVLNVADLLDVTAKSGSGTVIPLQTSPQFITPEINDTSADHQYVFAVNELSADRTVTLPLLTGGDTFVFESHAATLLNKTLTLPQINDTSSDHQYVFAVNELAADRTVTLPLLTGADTFVFEAHAATLTNKTLGSGTVHTVSPTGDGTLQWAEVTVSAGELLALRATPKTLVAGQAGKYLEFVSIQLFLDYNAAAYAEDGGGSNLGVRYTNGSGVQVSEDIEMTGYITQTGDYSTNSQAKKDAIVSKAGCEAQALVLHNIGAGELVTGDSPIRAKVAYRVWTTDF